MLNKCKVCTNALFMALCPKVIRIFNIFLAWSGAKAWFPDWISEMQVSVKLVDLKKMLQNTSWSLVPKFGFDTAKNGLPKDT